MLQDPSTATPVTPAPVGPSNAEAIQQMGFNHLVTHFDFVSMAVFITLAIMSFGSWFYMVVNAFRNARIRARTERIVRTFWDTPNAQDAIGFMEQQPKSEPFSKIELLVNDAPLPLASSTSATATLTAISPSVTAFILRAPAPVTARATFWIPCAFPECSGHRIPTGAGVMHS